MKSQYLKNMLTGLATVAFAGSVLAQSVPKPNAQQLAWQQAEMGVVFHYDLNVFDLSNYNQGFNRITPMPDYNIFNPEKLDVDQWVRAAKSAGAKFALLTATHETGFALFQSDYNPYCLKAVKWQDGKGDIVKDFVDACRKHDIKPGIYLGIRWNSFFGVHNFKVVGGDDQFQKNRQKYYNSMVEGMVKEICTKYGELFEIWFDGGASSPDKGAPDVLPIVKKYQPNALFYHNDQLAEARWGGSESGKIPYPVWSTFPYVNTGTGESTIKGVAKDGYALLKHGDQEGKYFMPAMADAPLRGYNGRHEWLWEPNDEKHIFPLKELMDIYYNSVGHNSTLIMGLTPDNTGLLPQADVDTLKKWGEEIDRRFANPMAQTKGVKVKNLVLDLKGEKEVSQVVLQEDLTNGQLVRAFRLEALQKGKWMPVNTGTAIGNKYIWLAEKSFSASKIRLVVNNAVGAVSIAKFAVYGQK